MDEPRGCCKGGPDLSPGSRACSGEARHDDVKAQAPRFAALPLLQIVKVKEGPFGSRAFDEDIKAEEAQGGGKSASQEIASRASDSADRPRGLC